MRLALLLLAFLWLAGSCAKAQDALFTIPETDTITQLLEPGKRSGMPATRKEALELYLDNCTAQKHPYLDEERLISLCLCTASYMKTRFDEPSILGMFGTGRAAQGLRNSALHRAYKPCMPGIIHDIALSECNTSAKGKKGLKHQEKVCACTAQGIAATLSEKSDWLVDSYISYYKTKTLDPLAFYMSKNALEEDMNYNFTRCLRWHEYNR